MKMKQRHIVGDSGADYGGDVRPILVPIECIQGDTGKKRRFFKVFKVAGKISITTVSKKIVQKKSDKGPWWISPTKSSTIR